MKFLRIKFQHLQLILFITIKSKQLLKNDIFKAINEKKNLSGTFFS